MLDQILRFAVIDDDPDDVRFLRRSLGKIRGLKFELREFTDPDSCSEPWRWQDVDVLFLDYLLGTDTGLDILKAIRAVGDPPRIIILTGQRDTRIAAKLIESGADDYIDKLDITPEFLEHSIKRVLSRRQVQPAPCKLLDIEPPKSDMPSVAAGRHTADEGG